MEEAAMEETTRRARQHLAGKMVNDVSSLCPLDSALFRFFQLEELLSSDSSFPPFAKDPLFLETIFGDEEAAYINKEQQEAEEEEEEKLWTLSYDLACCCAGVFLYREKEPFVLAPDRIRSLEDVWERYDDITVYSMFRFSRPQILYLCEKLGLPESVPERLWRYGKKVRADLVFAMLLLRLGNPVPITGLMAAVWGYSRTYISAWTNWMLHWLWDTWGHLMTFNNPYVERNAKKWSYKIGLRMGIPIPINCRCIAFLDGTFRYCARPKSQPGGIDKQRVAYNGYYGGHGFKYSAVVAPNGICIDLYGPQCGSNHDSFLLGMSGLTTHLKELPPHHEYSSSSNNANQEKKLSENAFHDEYRYYVYGDPAYSCVGGVIVSGYKGDLLTREQQEFNKMHNKCRVSVEHYFGAINRTFPAMKFTQNEKPQVSPIALKYLVAGLLTNFKTCMEGHNQISEMFACNPPSLDEYLSLPKVKRHDPTRLE